MQIKFDYYDLLRAAELLLKQRLNKDIDLDKLSPHDYPSIEYKERVFVYEKHKNGKEIKDEHGFRKVDWDKSEYVTKHIEFNDSSDITFYVGE